MHVLRYLDGIKPLGAKKRYRNRMFYLDVDRPIKPFAISPPPREFFPAPADPSLEGYMLSINGGALKYQSKSSGR